MVIEENWAVSLPRLQAFFAGYPKMRHKGEAFFLDGCRVTLTALPPGSLGPFPVARTLVRFEGEEAQVRPLYHSFFLEFLSAGG